MKPFIVAIFALLLAGCGATPATHSMKMPDADEMTMAGDMKMIDDPESWAIIAKAIGKPGIYARDVYTITLPREDLNISSATDPIPTAAGIETSLYFFKCSCGRMRVAGRFVVTDYEANDVISELQTEGLIQIASLAPMLLREKPRLLVIQFQGEGDAGKLATIIKGALDYTGDARMAPQKLPSR